MRNKHKQIETILASMNEGFAMVDELDRLMLINDSACRIFDCPAGVKKLDEATANEGLLAAVRQIRDEGGHEKLDLPAEGGEIYEISLNAVTTQDENGEEKKAVVMLLSDVTEKRQAAQMRQDFFRSASHELKTPITSIRGFAELLSADPDEDKRREFVDRIFREARRMDRLIEDILMISRLESGDIQFEQVEIDFYEVILECCDDARAFAMENDIDLFFEGVHCRMMGSHRELSELAGNLISNAVKYNRQGGYVEVKLRIVDGAPVLTVFNTGPAIPPAESKRIFERFYRLDRGRSKAAGGTGLGLSIVREVAANYGATVSITAKKDLGNIFRVAFPPEVLQIEEAPAGD